MTKDEIYIQYIVDLIRFKGFISCRKAFSFHESDHSRPNPTVKLTKFKEYWKKATETYSNEQEGIQKEKTKEYKEAELERQKRSNLNREKIVEMTANAVKLAYNNVVSSKGKDKDVYAFATILDKFCKLEGFEKPPKAPIGPDGGPQESALDKLIKAGGKIIING